MRRSLCVLALSAVLTGPAFAQQPHVHGRAELAIVQDGSAIDAQLVLTGGDAAGLPQSASDVLKTLSFNGEANCQLDAASASKEIETIGESKNHDHDHGHDHGGHAGHTNVIYSGRFTCGAPARLNGLTAGFLKGSDLTLEVQAVLDATTMVETLNASRMSLRFD